MGKNYWMFAEDGQNAAITRQIGSLEWGLDTKREPKGCAPTIELYFIQRN